jgi:hypothetical protein
LKNKECSRTEYEQAFFAAHTGKIDCESCARNSKKQCNNIHCDMEVTLKNGINGVGRCE